MTYHALSVARHGGKVDLIGYLETSLHPDILDNPGIQVLSQLQHLTRLLVYRLPPAQWLLVQNPPSIPTLLIGALVCRLRRTSLVIDWHNYGWTILAGTRGPRHPLVHLSRAYECLLGRAGDLNLTVTAAMGRQLRAAPYRVPGPLLTVHDRPARIFQPLGSAADRARALATVLPRHHPLLADVLAGRARLLVSSTSWTPDEDFGLLLDALVAYARRGAAAPLLALITGKGPQRELYVRKVAALRAAGALPGVTVETAFLPFADYAGLLASADLGVCLHRSSSGVDLPMKVVDMFGAGLPVAAYAGYESFGELVREGINGVGFQTAEELARILGRLLSDEGMGELAALRGGAVEEGRRRWDEEWDSTVGPVLGLVETGEVDGAIGARHRSG